MKKCNGCNSLKDMLDFYNRYNKCKECIKKENISRNRLMDELQKRNIFTQVHYIPVPLQYYYKKMGVY